MNLIRKKEKKGSEVAQWWPTLSGPWTVACQAPPSMRFSRQEYLSGLLFPSPEDLPTHGSSLGLPPCRQTLYHLSHQGVRFLMYYDLQ